MSAPMFTPGPWAAVLIPRLGLAVVHKQTGRVLASGASPNDTRLMAAAPDLYAACIAACAYLDAEHDAGIIKALNAALAKARGETSGN